jgi:hypothetical protein
MHNPATSDVASNSNDALVDSPCQNARVLVEHFPATPTAKEYGVVYPERPLANQGQFSVPFSFTIAVRQSAIAL